MNNRTTFILLLLTSMSVVASGQRNRAGAIQPDVSRSEPLVAAGPLSSPIIGYTADSVGKVQAILGVPGASLLSDPLKAPFGIAMLRFSPGQQYAIVEQVGTESAVLKFDGMTVGVPTPVVGAAANVVDVVFSPTGRSALLYTPEPRVQVLAGLPDSPEIIREIGPDALGGGFSVFAVSDDASVLLGAAQSGLVVWLAPDGSKVPLWNASQLPSLTFLPETHSAMLCDATAGQFVMLQNPDQNSSSWIVAGGVSGLGSDVRLNSTRDGKILFAAGLASNVIAVLDIGSSQVTALSVSAPPTGFDRLRTGDTFLFAAQDGQPAWMLDWRGGQPVVSFVARSSGRGAKAPKTGAR